MSKDRNIELTKPNTGPSWWNQSKGWKFACYSVDSLISHSVKLEHTLYHYLTSKSLGQSKHGDSQSHLLARGREEEVEARLFSLNCLHMIVCSLTEVGYNKRHKVSWPTSANFNAVLNFLFVVEFWDRFLHDSQGWSGTHLTVLPAVAADYNCAIIVFFKLKDGFINLKRKPLGNVGGKVWQCAQKTWGEERRGIIPAVRLELSCTSLMMGAQVPAKAPGHLLVSTGRQKGKSELRKVREPSRSEQQL